MPVKYTKMYKDGSWQKIEEDRVERFLEEGWTIEPKSEKKSQGKGSKNKIAASATVTSKPSLEETENNSLESWGDDPEEIDTLTFSEDDFEIVKKEN